MRYHKIRKMDISNGPGVRVSIFMQGCTFNCKNCFNPETHDFNGGHEFLEETIEKVLDLCSKDYIVGLSILGGEPMHPLNIDGTEKLVKAIKEKYYSVISFDNLAIKQLNLKEKLSKEEWDSFFMGDDGIDGKFSSASMYIDLVEQKFALNSCAPLDERYNCKDFNNDVNKMFSFLLKNT